MPFFEIGKRDFFLNLTFKSLSSKEKKTLKEDEDGPIVTVESAGAGNDLLEIDVSKPATLIFGDFDTSNEVLRNPYPVVVSEKDTPVTLIPLCNKSVAVLNDSGTLSDPFPIDGNVVIIWKSH